MENIKDKNQLRNMQIYYEKSKSQFQGKKNSNV